MRKKGWGEEAQQAGYGEKEASGGGGGIGLSLSHTERKDLTIF